MDVAGPIQCGELAGVMPAVVKIICDAFARRRRCECRPTAAEASNFSDAYTAVVRIDNFDVHQREWPTDAVRVPGYVPRPQDRYRPNSSRSIDLVEIARELAKDPLLFIRKERRGSSEEQFQSGQ